jgi:hypothetical protein
MDNMYLNGYGDPWPELDPAEWKFELRDLAWKCYIWALYNCHKTRRSKCRILSQEQKRQIITGLKGWIVQDDFDTTLSRLPPNIRYNFLACVASIIIFKDCLRLFWSNPFWCMECEGDFANSDDLETPLGAQLNGLCEEFLKGDLAL